MNQEMFNYSEEQKAKAAEFQKAAYEMGEPHIKDSGNRREFETGAVRDIAEGKGRCDLLPLDCVADFFNQFATPKYTYFRKADVVAKVLYELNEVQFYTAHGGAESHIMTAIEAFTHVTYEDKYGDAFMELSKHYEEGAKKYAERNWQKGISCHCYIDSCVRHLLKWYDGWNDEPHDRAVLWNLFGLWWTLKNKPEMNDLPWKKDGENT